MPLVTAVEPQKSTKGRSASGRKKPDRFNIFLDGKFAFGASLEMVLKNKLKVGQNLSETQTEQIIKEDQSTKLMDKAMNFLSYRPRSEKETRDFLIKKISIGENIKFSQAAESPLVGQTINKLKKYKYIDDIEFAKWWLESRKSRPKGRIILKFELIKKGIPKETIDRMLERSTDELSMAKKAVGKKIKVWQKLERLAFKKKLYSYLASRGFDFETIEKVFAFFRKKR